MPKPKRPDMRAYFQARIDYHVNGMMARSNVSLPREVVTRSGDVTDRFIRVDLRDGTSWYWTGGEYSTRKINGCYAPKMPKPITFEQFILLGGPKDAGA